MLSIASQGGICQLRYPYKYAATVRKWVSWRVFVITVGQMLCVCNYYRSDGQLLQLLYGRKRVFASATAVTFIVVSCRCINLV